MNTITVQVPDHMTESEFREQLERLSSQDWLANWWSIADVKNERPDLTDEQARDVLVNIERWHDSEVGINWQSIREIANMTYDTPEPCYYCGGNCEHDKENACDGYLGDIDEIYTAEHE